ncbi:glycosyltransferase family 4 protein [Arthrobacter sp. G.S.26]|uniref:glycosyltransferase family 4 protein n=1 Tax=Arthrobacter sp. G.S.26 TaxID=3433706 RepID=UPI003D77E7BD
MTSPLVLVLVQNLPLPGDRRVWLECKSLRDKGYRVAAITPAAAGDPAYEEYQGVHLHKYAPPGATSGLWSFIWEFIYCWIQTFLITLKVWKKHGKPAVIQSCNPPDTFFLIGLLLKPFGVKFIFDQHDLNPEVYESRFGKRGFFHWALGILEKLTYSTAVETIVTNESYAEIARSRGGVAAHKVTVVRTGPDTNVLTPQPPNQNLKRGRPYLAHFHGVMGPQDGVDLVIDTIHYVTTVRNRTDVSFSVLGKGDEWERLSSKVKEMKLEDFVYMPGRVTDSELFEYLSTADVGLSADPPGPLNNVSTMNKTMEYMAFGMPVLAFNLKETRFSAQESAVYVENPTPEAYGDELLRILDDADLRSRLGAAGRERATKVLDWKFQAQQYLAVFERVAGLPRPQDRITLGANESKSASK